MKYGKVDCEKNKPICEGLGIPSFPHILLFRPDGSIGVRCVCLSLSCTCTQTQRSPQFCQTGPIEPADLIAWVRSHVPADAPQQAHDEL